MRTDPSCSPVVTKERKVVPPPSCFSFVLVLSILSEPHEFAAVRGSAARGPVGNNAPQHGEGHNLHQDLRRRAALPHQRRVSSGIFRDFRGHRRGGGDHGQADGEIPRIRFCDHGRQGGSGAGVQRCQPHHRRQEGQREPGVPGSEASQLTDKSLCWSSASPSYVGSEAIRLHAAVRLPPGLPSAQPGAAVPAQSHSSSGVVFPLPGLQLRLQPLRPHRTGAVSLHPLTVALCWLPQLRLHSWHAGVCSDRIPDPSGCHPSSPGCTHHCVRRPSGFPSLPSAPARPHAVRAAELMIQNRLTVDLWHHKHVTV